MFRSTRSAKSKSVPKIPCADEAPILFDLLRLPPELIIHIGRFLPRYDLAALLWSSKHMCSLLAPLHYGNREAELIRATSGWKPRVMELLMDRLNVEPSDLLEEGNRNLLHVAIEAHDPTEMRDSTEQAQLLKTVELLLERGVPVAEKCSRGNTPLHRAARLNWAGVVELLLKRGGTMGVYDMHGDAPIHVAMEGILDSNTVCKASVVEVILNDSRLDALRTLCMQGASANIPTASDSSPLHLAINPRAADHYCTGQYVVGRAIAHLLLEYGADPNARDSEGLTPLHLAAQIHDAILCINLLSAAAGIDLNAQSTNQLGDTPLHHAIRHAQCSCTIPPDPCRRSLIAKTLLDAGCDVNATNGTLDTALHLAANSSCTAVVERLLEKGARVDKVDAKGETAVHISAGGKWEDVLKVLLRDGKREWMEVENFEGQSVWDVVRGRGKKKVVEILNERYRCLCEAEEKAKGKGKEVREKRWTRSMAKAE